MISAEYQRRWRKDHPGRGAFHSRKYRERHPRKHRQLANSARLQDKNKKQEWIAGIKAATPCFDCKQTFPAECMDFDHVRGKKAASVSALVRANASFQRLLQEMAKCEIVCANCHRIRTKQRKYK